VDPLSALGQLLQLHLAPLQVLQQAPAPPVGYQLLQRAQLTAVGRLLLQERVPMRAAGCLLLLLPLQWTGLGCLQLDPPRHVGYLLLQTALAQCLTAHQVLQKALNFQLLWRPVRSLLLLL
jgi:hypothetical protein